MHKCRATLLVSGQIRPPRKPPPAHLAHVTTNIEVNHKYVVLHVALVFVALVTDATDISCGLVWHLENSAELLEHFSICHPWCKGLS